MNSHNKEISRLRVKLSLIKKKRNNSKNQVSRNFHQAGINVTKSEILTHLRLKKDELKKMINSINREIAMYNNRK